MFVSQVLLSFRLSATDRVGMLESILKSVIIEIVFFFSIRFNDKDTNVEQSSASPFNQIVWFASLCLCFLYYFVSASSPDKHWELPVIRTTLHG